MLKLTNKKMFQHLCCNFMPQKVNLHKILNHHLKQVCCKNALMNV